MLVAVTGASGFIGGEVVRRLTAAGHGVLRIGRPAASGPGPDVAWDPARGELDAAALGGVEAVIHLAGEPIAQRWTASAKERIRSSRVQGTELLAQRLGALSPRPRVLVSMSAIGFYGDRGDETLDEQSRRGTGFLADTAALWEASTEPARQAGIRVAVARLGIALHRSGGALAKLLPVFSAGMGGPIGSGAQWMSWISRDDAVNALLFVMGHDTLAGPVNLTAPQPVRNREFASALGGVQRRPAVLPAPAWAIRAAFGQMGVETVLAGQRVLPARLAEAGFRFTHATLVDALRASLS
jgi:hypothetical protein